MLTWCCLPRTKGYEFISLGRKGWKTISLSMETVWWTWEARFEMQKERKSLREQSFMEKVTFEIGMIGHYLQRDFADWAQCVQQWGLSWEQPETPLGHRDLMVLLRSLDLAQWTVTVTWGIWTEEWSEKHNLAVEEPGFEQSSDASVTVRLWEIALVEIVGEIRPRS